MKYRKNGIYEIVNYFIIIFWMISIFVMAFIPLHPETINIQVLTNKEIFVQQTYNVSNGETTVVLNVGEGDVLIKSVNFYSSLLDIKLGTILGNQMYQYIDSDSKIEMEYIDNGLCLKGISGSVITSNLFKEKIAKLSKSRLHDRLAFMLVSTTIFGLALYFWITHKDKMDSKYGHGIRYEIKRFKMDFIKYREYITYSASTDLNAEVSNSYLNRLWWLLEPFFNMLVYVLIFGKLFGSSIENYASFLFSSLLFWNYFNKVINSSTQLIRTYRGIVANIYIPKFVLLLSVIVLNMYKLFFSFIVLIPMLLITHVQIGWNVFIIIPAILTLLLLTFGMGMMLIHLGVYIDDLSYAVSILLNMLCFLSGVFYDVITTIPEPINQLLMILNPLAVIIDTIRNALLYNQPSNISILIIWSGVAVVLSLIGIHTVYKYENAYIKVI